jgi:hypothetical protein
VPVPAEIREIVQRARPVSMAHERVLPTTPSLCALLPDGGLRRGSTIHVDGLPSLGLALAAAPSSAGSWCAAVGASDLGMLAASELGINLERFPLIDLGRRPAKVLATAIEVFDLILFWPRGLQPSEARRLAARAWERGTVLVICNQGWPGPVDVQLSALGSRWVGIDRGHGRLRARLVDIETSGRGAASAPRRIQLWLPSIDGRITIEGDSELAPGLGQTAAIG